MQANTSGFLSAYRIHVSFFLVYLCTLKELRMYVPVGFMEIRHSYICRQFIPLMVLLNYVGTYCSIPHIGPPSCVLVSFEESILREWGGTTGVECTAVGGSAGAHHLMLWRHGGQLLASINGSHLRYQTTPHQYGTYTCSVGNISNSSTLQERGTYYDTCVSA